MAASKEASINHTAWMYSKGSWDAEKYISDYNALFGENPTSLPRLYARNFWDVSFVSADSYEGNTGEHLGYIGGLYPDDIPELGGSTETTAQDYAIYEGDPLPYDIPEEHVVNFCSKCGAPLNEESSTDTSD